MGVLIMPQNYELFVKRRAVGGLILMTRTRILMPGLTDVSRPVLTVLFI